MGVLEIEALLEDIGLQIHQTGDHILCSTTTDPTICYRHNVSASKKQKNMPSARRANAKVIDMNEGETFSKPVPVVTLYRFATCTWLSSKLSRDSDNFILDPTQRNQRLVLPTQRSGFEEGAKHPVLI